MEYAIHRRPENYKISNSHRHQEIDVIDRSGHHMIARMAVRGHRSRQVDPVHQASTKQRSERIRVVGQHDFSHF
jgi:hypothetical protein